MAKFVPFDKFEKSCSPVGAPLNETMQESCNEKFQPDVPIPCNDTPCPPYWQLTGEKRCLGNGLVDVEEQDGCGNSRWSRTSEKVKWTPVGTPFCVTNKFKQEQENQCGDTKEVFTGDLCCIPEWTPSGAGSTYRCDRSLLEQLENDGCGNERWVTLEQAVSWSNTGNSRCIGLIFELEQQNQCGNVRWVNAGVPCPEEVPPECVPSWVATTEQRCTGAVIENKEADGCGNIRWVATATTVEWADINDTRCIGGLLQKKQANQCGTIRWFDTAISCDANLSVVIPFGDYAAVSTRSHDSNSSFKLVLTTDGYWTIALIGGAGSTSGTPKSGAWHSNPSPLVGNDYEVKFVAALDITVSYTPDPSLYNTPTTGWMSLSSAQEIFVYMHLVGGGAGTGDVFMTGTYTVHIRKIGGTEETESLLTIDLSAFIF